MARKIREEYRESCNTPPRAHISHTETTSVYIIVNVQSVSQSWLRFPDSSNRQSLCMGRTNDVEAPVLTSTVRTNPSRPGTTIEPLHNGQLGDRRKWPLWRGGRYEEVGVYYDTIFFKKYLTCLLCQDHAYCSL